MYIIFKTSQGNIRVSGSALIISVVATLFLLITIIRAADVNTTYSTIVMNATVTNTIGVNLSSALQRGILFGSVSGNTSDNMAENDTTGTGNVTEYWIGNDPSSTGSINLFHNASDMDRGGASDTILIANVTHEANKTQPDSGSNVNMTNKASGGDIAMTNAIAQIGSGNCTSVAASSSCWVAYWLDVPTIRGGTYNTTYEYCGNLTFSSATC